MGRRRRGAFRPETWRRPSIACSSRARIWSRAAGRAPFIAWSARSRMPGSKSATRSQGRDEQRIHGGYNGLNVEVVGVRDAGKVYPASRGRWPANVAHDGSDEVTAAFPDSRQQSGGNRRAHHTWGGQRTWIRFRRIRVMTTPARPRGFFYTAKADADDRLGSKHPTVKPLDLMQWLVRLVTPQGRDASIRLPAPAPPARRPGARAAARC